MMALPTWDEPRNPTHKMLNYLRRQNPTSAGLLRPILPGHIRKSFEADFVVKRPTMYEYIQKLRRWRDKFEEKLDHRVQSASLESYSHHLSEFRFLKFDEVEVPGQYLQHKDKNTDFIRIERFLPTG